MLLRKQKIYLLIIEHQDLLTYYTWRKKHDSRVVSFEDELQVSEIGVKKNQTFYKEIE